MCYLEIKNENETIIADVDVKSQLDYIEIKVFHSLLMKPVTLAPIDMRSDF